MSSGAGGGGVLVVVVVVLLGGKCGRTGENLRGLVSLLLLQTLPLLPDEEGLGPPAALQGGAGGRGGRGGRLGLGLRAEINKVGRLTSTVGMKEEKHPLRRKGP